MHQMQLGDCSQMASHIRLTDRSSLNHTVMCIRFSPLFFKDCCCDMSDHNCHMFHVRANRNVAEDSKFVPLLYTTSQLKLKVYVMV